MNNQNIINLENALIDFIQHELGLVNNIPEQEENPYKKKVKKDYLDSLVTLTNVDNKICNICFDKIKVNEECIKLPCEGSEHYFHKNSDENCGGIMKWLNTNNTCPCCRYEFPYEEYRINEDEDEEQEEQDIQENQEVPDVQNDPEYQEGYQEQLQHRVILINNPFINFINEVNREQEDIQRAIELSLMDS